MMQVVIPKWLPVYSNNQMYGKGQTNKIHDKGQTTKIKS